MKRIFALTAIAGAVALALVFMPGSMADRMNDSIRDAFSPFLSLVSDSAAFLRGAFRSAGRLAAENRKLDAELGRMRLELDRLAAVEEENRELRSQLGLMARLPGRLIAAEVIGRDLNTWWSTIRINKGAVDGVARDQPVMSADGLVGRVADVSGYTSDVLLMLDPDCRVSARLSRGKAFGIVEGSGDLARGGAPCRMTYIGKDIEIGAGDEIFTSGLGGVFPAGLKVGHVGGVALDRSGLFQYADVLPAADIARLRIVYVMAPAAGRAAPPDEGEGPRR